MIKLITNNFQAHLEILMEQSFQQHFGTVLTLATAPIIPTCKFFFSPQCKLSDFFSKKELSEYETISMEKRKHEYLTGRICAKHATIKLVKKTNNAPPTISDITISNHESGRPYIEASAFLNSTDVSISHSGDFAGAVACNTSCGMDIQEHTPSLHKVLSKYRSYQEKSLLQKINSKSEETGKMAQLWCAKEAMRKAASEQRLFGFLEFVLVNVTNLEKNINLLSFLVNANDGKNMQLHCLSTDLGNTHGLAIATVTKE